MDDLKLELEIMKLAVEARAIFDKGDAHFTKKRQELDLDAAFDSANYTKKVERAKCLNILTSYLNQLSLEKQFYEKLGRQSLHKILKLLSNDLRVAEKYKVKVIPRVMEGLSLRLNINREKYMAVSKSIQLIELYRKLDKRKNPSAKTMASIDALDSAIVEHLQKQYELAQQQRQNNVDGMYRVQKLFETMNSHS